MKKLFIALLISITILTFSSTRTYAQDDGTTSVDSSKIDESLKSKGLDKAPGVIEVPKSEMLGEKPYSGFRDEKGNPISDEDYSKMQEDDKSRSKRNQFILAISVVILTVATVAVLLLAKRRSLKRTN